MKIEYALVVPPYGPEFIAQLSALGEAVFGAGDLDLAWRLSNMPSATVFCAYSEGQLVGFKAGYAMSRSKYYSWLGGVHPDYLRQGIASGLMEAQHGWLREQGFQRVETASNQENFAMAQANLKHGLLVCGMRHEPHRVQVLFAKAL